MINITEELDEQSINNNSSMSSALNDLYDVSKKLNNEDFQRLAKIVTKIVNAYTARLQKYKDDEKQEAPETVANDDTEDVSNTAEYADGSDIDLL